MARIPSRTSQQHVKRALQEVIAMMPPHCPPVVPQAFTVQMQASFVCSAHQATTVLILLFPRYSVHPAHMLVIPVCSVYHALRALIVLLKDYQFIIHVNPVTSLTPLVQSSVLSALQVTAVLIIQPHLLCVLRAQLALRGSYLVWIVQLDFMLMSQEYQIVFHVLRDISVVMSPLLQ